MIGEMDSYQLAEWMAMDRIDAEAERRAELAAKAENGVRNYKRKR